MIMNTKQSAHAVMSLRCTALYCCLLLAWPSGVAQACQQAVFVPCGLRAAGAGQPAARQPASGAPASGAAREAANARARASALWLGAYAMRLYNYAYAAMPARHGPFAVMCAPLPPPPPTARLEPGGGR